MQAKKGNTRYSEVPKTFMDQLNQQHDDSSMINFDLSQSKIITDQHHQQQLRAGNNPLTLTVIESESHNNTNTSNNTSGAMQQIKKRQLISDMEAEVLPLVKLPPSVG